MRDLTPLSATGGLIARDEHAVVRARVFNDEESHHVASFGTASGGVLASLVEVWSQDAGETAGTPRAAAG